MESACQSMRQRARLIDEARSALARLSDPDRLGVLSEVLGVDEVTLLDCLARCTRGTVEDSSVTSSGLGNSGAAPATAPSGEEAK